MSRVQRKSSLEPRTKSEPVIGCLVSIAVMIDFTSIRLPAAWLSVMRYCVSRPA